MRHKFRRGEGRSWNSVQGWSTLTVIIDMRGEVKVKGQGNKVTSLVWCMFARNSTKKGRRNTKIGRKVVRARVTFRTSSKVKRPKGKVIAVTDNQPYLRNGDRNSVLGRPIRMEYDEPHHRHALSPRAHSGTTRPASLTCTMTSNCWKILVAV